MKTVQKSRGLKVAVVIPAYNEEKYLAACLSSLHGQDYAGDYEITVVDNGSTDGTADIARSFGVRLVSCPERGVVLARQKGALLSDADVIVQADADSVLPANWLSSIARHFENDGNIVGLAGSVKYIRAPWWVSFNNLLHVLINWLCFKAFHRPLVIRAANFHFRRVPFQEIGGYNVSIPTYGDEHDFFVRINKKGRVIYVPGIVAYTSARRFKKGFLHYVFVDFFYRIIVNYFAYRLRGCYISVRRDDIREEPKSARKLVRGTQIFVASVLVGFIMYGFFVPSSQAFGKVVVKGKSADKIIALTFDDGPNEPYTSQMLDILRNYGVRGTFFLVGKNVERYPETARRILAEGHVLGNHSYTHSRISMMEGPRYTEVDIAGNAIEKATGVRPRIFRPPYGEKTPWQLDYVKDRGMVTITWDVSANDPNIKDPYVIADRIISRARPGSIILLHDGRGMQHGFDRSFTVGALPMIIDALLEEGYTFVTVPELLHVSPYLP